MLFILTLILIKIGGFIKFSIDVSKLSLSFNYNLSGLNMACQADVNYSLIISNSSKEVDSITASDFSKEVQLIDLSTLLNRKIYMVLRLV